MQSFAVVVADEFAREKSSEVAWSRIEFDFANQSATSVETGSPLFGQSGRAVGQESQVAAKITESDHRDAAAGQGVVCVVPLGPLGVHPDAAVRNRGWKAWKARAPAAFRRDWRDRPSRPVRSGACRRCPWLATRFSIRESSSRHRIRSWRLDPAGCRIGLDPVGNLGVAEDLRCQAGRPGTGSWRSMRLEKLQQVDDLVIAPVADVAPGIIRRTTSQSTPSRVMR